MSGIGAFYRPKLSFALDETLNLSSLAALTGVDESELVPLLYRPLDTTKGLGTYLIFGIPISPYFIRVRYPKICPECLRESAYCRKIWDLTPVTTCPIHKCLLIDECPSCSRRLRWARSRVSRCRCKFDWRECSSASVEETELAITQQIHLLCSLPAADSDTIIIAPANPLYNLDLGHFISALVFIASQFKGIIDTKGKKFATSIRNTEIHSLLSDAYRVFEDWPNNYFTFLEWRRKNRGDARNAPGFKRDFGAFQTALSQSLSSQEFDFLRTAFDEYITTLWDGGYTSRINRPGISAQRNKKYMTRNRAKRQLNTTLVGIDGFIDAGLIKAVINGKGKSKITLIETASLEVLKEKLEGALDLRKVQSLLGVQPPRIQELVEGGLLTPLRGPNIDGNKRWRFNRKEVQDLLRNLQNGLVLRHRSRESDLLTFLGAVRRVSNAGIGFVTFTRAILNGEIKLFGRSQKPGMGGFLFSSEQISSYMHKDGNALSLPEVAKLIDLTLGTIRFLVDKGILKARPVADRGALKYLVDKADLELFDSTYVLIGKLMSELRTNGEYLIKVLMSHGVKPISGPTVDYGKAYIFCKSDLEGLDLAGLISLDKAEKAALRAIRPVLDQKEAAEVLGIKEKTIKELVGAGVLRPHRRLMRNAGNSNQHYFSPYTIKKFQEQKFDYTGLVSSTVAARMLGVSDSGLFVIRTPEGCEDTQYRHGPLPLL